MSFHSWCYSRKRRRGVSLRFDLFLVLIKGITKERFLSDLFLVLNNVDLASYADDNTIYTTGENIDEVIFYLQESSKKLFKWFTDNQMNTNEDKCHLIVSTTELLRSKSEIILSKIVTMKNC